MPEQKSELDPGIVSVILDALSGAKAVLVGGQAIALLAENFVANVPELADFIPITSKDIDFFGDKAVATVFASQIGGTLQLPKPFSNTPHSALVLFQIGSEEVTVDFLSSVLGVEANQILDRAFQMEIHLEGDRLAKALVLNPIDCLKSKLTNINRLGRTDDIAIKQAEASVYIALGYLHWLLEIDEHRRCVRHLKEMFLYCREVGFRVSSYKEFGINPAIILERFLGDDRIDARFQKHQLKSWIGLLDAKRRRQAG